MHYHFARLMLTACMILVGMNGGAFGQQCTVNMPNVLFGDVDVLPGAEVTTAANLQVTCSGGDQGDRYQLCIAVNAGTGTISNRQMASGTNRLNYNLFKDSSRTQVWGNWSGGITGVSAGITLGSGGTFTLTQPVYASVAAGQQLARTGSYTSSLTATVDYVDAWGPCPLNESIDTDAFTVTGTVVPKCLLDAQPLNFGSVTSLAAPVDAASNFQVRCSNQLPYSVAMDGGLTNAANPSNRAMTSGGNTVSYGLYRDAARTLPWGSALGSNTTSGTGSGADQAFNVYGRVPSQANPIPGSYSDTVVITIAY